MSELVTALQVELFKTRRLRLVWALLGLMLVFLVLNSVLSYQAYQDVRRFARLETGAAQPEDRHATAMQQEMLAVALRSNLVMPSAYAGVTGVLYFPGFVLITIAAGSLVANEFGWGTAQRVLARGRRRWAWLGAKLGTVAVLAAGAVVIGLAAGSVGGFATSQALHAWRPQAFSAETWQSLGVMTLRLWAVLTVYGVVAAAAGFYFRNTGLAVGGALVYYFVEALVSGLIVQTRGWLSEIRPYLLGNVAHSLVVTHNPFVSAMMGGQGERALEAAARGLDPGAAWVALAGWGLLFSAVCVASFARRDLPV
ncbi:hypothetical protein U7230_15055 [Carboxydochorda subterranea]|uniref:ABC-type transport system involved in multi-copper enzyme maturation permease subunit n=1 Tax=Carboxydichorda subterranea TaxID=3109565 RepID=A0ABZ1BXE8_9FIRM|nr:hypothetical protein [Limnochorda sp. L945t]WRP17378.1 hypothetical protein U7230_15055 [Limnochorda sp. L945t]